MLSKLPYELLLEIVYFLNFSEINYLKYLKLCEFHINYSTYKRQTKYTNRNGEEYFQTSYLLTNGKEELPTQIKDNFVEIKLYCGKVIYEFTIYKNIYSKEKDILYYLKYYDKKMVSYN